MTQENLRQLAKQGNPKALATIINQSLKSKSITAKVGLKDDCLQVLLESAKIPNQQAMVSFIRNGLTRLEVESIKTVKVYGRQLGEESPAWNQAFEMMPEVEMPSIPEPMELETPLSPQEIELETPSSTQEDYQDLYAYQTARNTPRPISSQVNTPSSTRQTNRQNLRNSSATSQNSSSRPSISSLSVGDVVSAALRIYRDHFKLYWGLAFSAYAWVLVPVYGWAKFFAISALISRLAFSEVIERPETVTEARRHVMPRMWNFLLAGFLVSLIFWGIGLGGVIIFTNLAGVVGAILVPMLIQNTGALVIVVLLAVVTPIASLIAYIRLFSRLLIVEVPLALENNLDATSTISRSWQLTKGYVSRLQWIVFVAFLITLPISIVIQIVQTILQFVLSALLPTDSGIFALLYFLLFVALTFVSGSLLIPFWQTIKAIIYYDLCNQKEGRDLQIRDSNLR
jgi:hypothetical protein